MLTVDCVTLLEPIPGDSPAGDASHFAMTLAPELRELRREESADEFEDNTRPTQLKRADWAEAARRCEASLNTQAKDLRTACNLVEAWTRLDGIAGLAKGLELLARLAEDCWDRVTPAPGDDPAESRGTPLANLLDDPDRGVCFPSLLRTLPLIGTPETSHSYADWTRLRSGRSAGETEQLTRARQAIAPERFKQLHDDASAALGWLERLTGALHTHLGDSAPGLLNLRAALTDLQGLLGDEVDRLGYPSGDAAATAGVGEDQPATAPTGPLGGAGREQLYTLLDDTAERLRTMEPHSPIPYLIKRAVRLGRLPFPSLMQHVIREPLVLTELNREFGIAEAEGSETLA